MSTARAAVYNRFWQTRGGGERYSGMIAQCLARRGVAVDLLGHAEVDLDDLGSHLGLDLRGCTVRVIPDLDEESLSRYSADYDLFISGSYMSRVPNEAKHSAYVCFFPTPPDHDLSPGRRRAAKLLRPLLGRDATSDIAFGSGWYWPEGGVRRRWRWTAGSGELTLTPGPARTLRFTASRVGMGETDLRVVRPGGEAVATFRVGDRFAHHSIAIPATEDPVTLLFRSDVRIPSAEDTRDLGVALGHFRFRGRPDLRRRLAHRLRWVQFVDAEHGYLDGYDVIVAISQYTLGWITHYWDRSSEILYPPIDVDQFVPAPAREKSIVSVGRFFAPEMGHSKRQLEQAQVFARMQRDGLLPGWTLHLIGGCEAANQPYLDQVKAAAEGYRVEFHVNAPRAELEHLLTHASLQWSATGYGSDESSRPWANEHFGITTVEAMAAGCVPVVIDRAGQREIVRHGIDGYRWNTLDELAEFTVKVAGDDDLRASMAAAAIEAARVYSDQAFAARLDELVDQFGLLP